MKQAKEKVVAAVAASASVLALVATVAAGVKWN